MVIFAFPLLKLCPIFSILYTNALPPIVLLIDTFQDAPKELQNWIEGSFLSEVVRLENFVVVTAGQTVPQPTVKWRRFHHLIELKPILKVEDWHSYTQWLGMPFRPEEMTLLIQHLKGKPNEIMQAFQGLEQGGMR